MYFDILTLSILYNLDVCLEHYLFSSYAMAMDHFFLACIRFDDYMCDKRKESIWRERSEHFPLFRYPNEIIHRSEKGVENNSGRKITVGLPPELSFQIEWNSIENWLKNCIPKLSVGCRARLLISQREGSDIRSLIPLI